jgi:hypothetical protein
LSTLLARALAIAIVFEIIGVFFEVHRTMTLGQLVLMPEVGCVTLFGDLQCQLNIALVPSANVHVLKWLPFG